MHKQRAKITTPCISAALNVTKNLLVRSMSQKKIIHTVWNAMRENSLEHAMAVEITYQQISLLTTMKISTGTMILSASAAVCVRLVLLGRSLCQKMEMFTALQLATQKRRIS